MPFIGKQPQAGAYSKLDSITTSATATYNLTLSGSAYYPSSANHLLVSLNGVLQAPQDSFTVSGSQITFASALTSADSIDFIMALGDVLDIGTPSAGATVPGDFNVNGNLGVGTGSSSHLIHAVGADSSRLIVAENATGVKTGIGQGTNDGRIGNITNHGLVFLVNDTEKARITTGGQFRLSSAGITFNGDSSTANELNDYEEGTWTPAFSSGSGGFNGSALNTIEDNSYTKIGNKVYLTASFKVTGGGNIAEDDYLTLTAASLPFTPINNNIVLGVATSNQSISTGSAAYHIVGTASTGVMVITCANIRGTTTAAQTNFTHMAVTYITND